jgi:hypothetical protein
MYAHLDEAAGVEAQDPAVVAVVPAGVGQLVVPGVLVQHDVAVGVDVHVVQRHGGGAEESVASTSGPTRPCSIADMIFSVFVLTSIALPG